MCYTVSVHTQLKNSFVTSESLKSIEHNDIFFSKCPSAVWRHNLVSDLTLEFCKSYHPLIWPWFCLKVMITNMLWKLMRWSIFSQYWIITMSERFFYKWFSIFCYVNTRLPAVMTQTFFIFAINFSFQYCIIMNSIFEHLNCPIKQDMFIVPVRFHYYTPPKIYPTRWYDLVDRGRLNRTFWGKMKICFRPKAWYLHWFNMHEYVAFPQQSPWC